MRTYGIALIALMLAPGVAAQEVAEPRERAPLRTRVALGPQFQPAFPGADRMVVRPFVDFARARGETPFEFEAQDESFGFPVFRIRGFEIGPAIGFEGARKTRDARGLPRTGFTVEPGGFIQYGADPVRVRAEVRHGIGGHKGLIAVLSADYIARDRDDWLFSAGPRITLSNGRYQRAFFGVPASSTAATGLAEFTPNGGVHAVGANVGYLRQLDDRWGINSFVRYDRLVDDAARSPFIRRDGARDQWSGGIALSYTFGGRRD